jgi:hypothetical protein
MASLKRYHSIQEIEAEPNYQPRHPVSIDNYKLIVGWYKFPEGQEAQCCVQKPNGNLCNTKHLHGFVAEITDGTLTIIGGDCGTDKFGVDSTIGKDISYARRAIDEQDKLARLAELLAKRDEALHELLAFKTQLMSLRKTVAMHKDRVGRVAWNALMNMLRTGNSTIRVLGFTPEVCNDNGDVIQDRRSLVIQISSFSGTGVCNEAKITSALDRIRQIEGAYKRAGEEAHLTLKPKEVRALNAALADQPREVAAARELIAQMSLFEANDFTALAFTVTDAGERIRLIQYGLERRDGSGSRNAAKKFLQEWEAILKLQYGVKHIRLQ